MTPSHAKGCYVFDKKGNKFLDLYGGHAVISIGHSHPNYVSSLSNQLNKIGFYSNYIINDLQELVAKKLIAQSNCENYELFMCSSGAEANENALQIASFHNNKSRIIAFKNSFHGRSNAALSATDNQSIKKKLNTKIDVTFLKFNDKESLINEVSKSDVSAIIFESIQGVGGLDEPDTEFVKFLRETCDKYDICLIADEVQSGFCRTGKWFSYQHFNVSPDVVMVAKALGNGVPIGACLAKGNAANVLKAGMHGSTFGGNYLSTSVGLCILDIMRDSHTCQHVKEISSIMKDEMHLKLKGLKSVSDIRIYGMMIGIELNCNCTELVVKALEKGLVLNVTKEKIIRLLPPLICEKKHILSIVNIIEELIKDNYD